MFTKNLEFTIKIEKIEIDVLGKAKVLLGPVFFWKDVQGSRIAIG